MKRARKLLLVGSMFALVLVSQCGCAGPRGTAKEVAIPLVQKVATESITTGTVVESTNAGGYTYLRLEKNGQSNWVAVPTMEVTPGQEVEFQPGVEMGPFISKSLNRTFERIVFSSGPKAGIVSAAAPLPSGHPAVGAVPAATAVKAAPEVVPAAKQMIYAGKVVETMVAANYTYLCLEKDGVQSWAAIPLTEVKVGDEVEINKGMAMGQFTSISLDRTFENIIFSNGLVPKK